ncbi:MAG: class I SAM-dependent methyltransferase [Deltaproteobacteria bacterium]|nr:MAG: class I SAM-dependent methyltransferase [Deltaproteobacteria bacterium]
MIRHSSTTHAVKYYQYNREEMLSFIPKDARSVLDVGCASGRFGALVKHKIGAEVWGIEIEKKMAEEAAKRLDKLLTGDVSVCIADLPENYFDCIIFNDILEHLADPFSVLTSVMGNLSARGRIVCSIPNIRHFKVLKKLVLKGEWEYKEAGILDRTHLRFFTYKSIRKTMDSLGYTIEILQGLKPIKKWKHLWIIYLFYPWLWDTRFYQFACVAKPSAGTFS